MKIKYFALFLILLTFLLPSQDKPYVIMVSFDGFRFDYPDRVDTPNFDYLQEHGVKAASMQPVFPSKTFPNHYSLATGAYTGTHMLSDNHFYDKKFKEQYTMMEREKVQDPKWYQAEPIWVTAERQGVIAASYFWVGSEAPVKGTLPSIFKLYDGSVPFDTRVDSVVSWLRLPENIRPHLIMLYFSEPDFSGHIYGPESSEVTSVISEMDGILGLLREGIQSLPISNQINLVVVSDHGMQEINQERIVILDDYISKMNDIYINGRGTHLQIDLKKTFYPGLKKQLEGIPHVSVYSKDSLPGHFHFLNRNTGEYVLVADGGWLVLTKKGAQKRGTYKGEHGYDPVLKSMHSIFYAYGPAFKSGYVVDTFENVHVYPMVCNVLNIAPYHNEIDGPDGRLEILQHILK